MHIPALRRQLQRWWRGTPPAGGTAPASGGPRFKPLSREQLRSLPNDVSGWWLVLAETLGVAVLLILADVTGRTARGL